MFLEAHRRPPAQIILDLDATDDPLHGNQEGRFFHGYYDCHCYLPLYIFCGRHLLAARLRRSNIDGAAGVRSRRWHALSRRSVAAGRRHVFCCAAIPALPVALMAWCEANRVNFLFGLARNERLEQAISTELMLAKFDSLRTGRSARRFRTSPGRRWTAGADRRVVGKAEVTGGDANPRVIVTSLKPSEVAAQHLYETIYCARGEMENRIKECQLDLFADRTSAATMRANQLRLWFASMATMLLSAPCAASDWRIRRSPRRPVAPSDSSS